MRGQGFTILLTSSVVLMCTSAHIFLTTEDETLNKFLGDIALQGFDGCATVLNTSPPASFNFPHKFQSLETVQINIGRTSAVYQNQTNPHVPSLQRNFGYERKHHPRCQLVIVVVTSTIIANLFPLIGFVTSSAIEVVRKDTDHFLFISNNVSDSTSILLSKDFGEKIKFKVLLEFSNKEARVIARAVCFYCHFGMPKIISMEISSASNDMRSALFPDFVEQFNGFQLVFVYPVRTTQLVETMYDQNTDEYLPKGGAYPITLFAALKPRFNFTVKLLPSSGDGGTGLLLPNGTWVGCVGDILNGRAHAGMVVGQIFQRFHLVEFSFSVAYEWVTFTTGKSYGKFTAWALYEPFTTSVWLMLLAAIFIATIVIAIFTMYLPERWRNTRVSHKLFGALVEQSFATPRQSPVRLVFASWLILGVVITTAYRSKLYGSLICPDLIHVPQSYKELAASTEYSWGLNYIGGAAYTSFATSTDKTYKTIYEKMALVNGTECYERTLSYNFACIAWESLTRYYIQRRLHGLEGKDRLTQSKALTLFIACGFGYERRAIFKTNFDRVIHMTHTSGLVGKWQKRDADYIQQRRLLQFNKRMTSLPDRSMVDARQLKFDNLIGGLYVLINGFFMGFITFCLEVVTSKFCKFNFFTKFSKPVQVHRRDF